MIRYDLRPIENDKEFERFCCEVAREVFGDYAAQCYGRGGQKQGGIDIRATNRRAGGGSIVIQCKYKAATSMPKMAAIVAELRKEFSSAIAVHTFDEFVFAGTWPRDKALQDAATELSEASGKGVLVWSRDDLVDYANVHPRLQRLFLQGRASYGVELIDKQFVNDLDDVAVDPFSFYLAVSANRLQWSGVAHGFDAPRLCRAAIDSRIDTLFAKTMLNTRIAAVIHGEGGSGKSTLLRRIAVNRAQSGDCICWWVESLEQFLIHDAVSISESPQSRHLIFIDDWYRNVRASDSSEFFLWLQERRHVLAVIGDRDPMNRPYLRHVYGASSALHELRPAENKAILDRVLSAVGDSAASTAWFKNNSELVGSAPLFVVLFVLSHEEATSDDAHPFDLDDGIEATFQMIIARKLQQLERSDHFSGFGSAVVLLAHLYAAEESPWQVFSEEFLTHAAHFFAGAPDARATSRLGWHYPKALSALMHRVPGLRKTSVCRFNHDVIAERGVVNVGLHAPELDIDRDPRSEQLHDLLAYLIKHKVASGALVLWCWFAYRDGFSSERSSMDALQEILGLCAEVSFFPNFTAILSSIRSREGKSLFFRTILRDVKLLVKLGPGICLALKSPGNTSETTAAARAILATDDFVALPNQIVSTALNIVAREEAGKAAARTILATDDFVALPHQIVSTALNIVAREEAGRAAVRAILATDDFVALPQQIVSTALNIVAREEAGKAAARAILATDNFVTLPDSIVSTALNTVAREEAGKAAARAILTTDDFVTLPDSIVSTALNIVAKEETGKVAARAILATDNFVTLRDSIVSTALKTVAGEGAGKAAARAILATDDFVALPHQIVSTALNIVAREKVGKAAARAILATDNFVTLPDSIVSTALNTVAGEEAGKAAARAILATANFVTLPQEIVSTALKTVAGEEAGKAAARAILATDNFVSLPQEIVSTALNIVVGEEAGKAAARAILATDNFVTLPQEIVSTALNIVAGEEAGKAAARAILATNDFVAVPQEIVSTALYIVAGEEAGKAAARAILATDNFVTLPDSIVSTALNSVAGEEAGKAAARAILATDDFVALPHQIVSIALNIVAGEEAGKQAALRVLAQSDHVTTFLQFAAVRALARATDESMRSIAEDFVRRACMPPFSGKGSLRLRHDLLFLPYARVTLHRRFTEKIAASYHPACAVAVKRDVYKILRCRSEYGPQREIAVVVDDLCERVARACADDLEHQWRVNRDAPQLGHIWTSLELLSPSPAYVDAVDRLRAYEAANRQVADWAPFRYLMRRTLAASGDRLHM